MLNLANRGNLKNLAFFSARKFFPKELLMCIISKILTAAVMCKSAGPVSECGWGVVAGTLLSALHRRFSGPG